jgi:hypothetical protein
MRSERAVSSPATAKLPMWLKTKLFVDIREPHPEPVEWNVGEIPNSTQRRQSGS